MFRPSLKKARPGLICQSDNMGFFQNIGYNTTLKLICILVERESLTSYLIQRIACTQQIHNTLYKHPQDNYETRVE